MLRGTHSLKSRAVIVCFGRFRFRAMRKESAKGLIRPGEAREGGYEQRRRCLVEDGRVDPHEGVQHGRALHPRTVPSPCAGAPVMVSADGGWSGGEREKEREKGGRRGDKVGRQEERKWQRDGGSQRGRCAGVPRCCAECGSGQGRARTCARPVCQRIKVGQARRVGKAEDGRQETRSERTAVVCFARVTIHAFSPPSPFPLGAELQKARAHGQSSHRVRTPRTPRGGG